MTTRFLGRAMDWVNTELRGREQENPLMRGMNPAAVTKNEEGLGDQIRGFEDMVDKMMAEDGFETHNRPYFRSDPNATDSVGIAASYATGGGEDYLLMQFDEEIESYHMFGREYHVPGAGWPEIQTLVASGENTEYLEQRMEEVSDPPEIIETMDAPRSYRQSREVPEGVKDEGRWQDVVYTVEKLSEPIYRFDGSR